MRCETGIQVLDTLTGGGIPIGTALLIYGNPGTGKTSLAMTVIANLARRCAGSAVAVIVDTEMAWRGGRLSSILKNTGLDQGSEDVVRIYEASSMGEQHKIIMNVVPKDLEIGEFEPKVVVVDSLVCHYHAQLIGTPTTFLASRARELQGKISLEIQTLLRLANSYNAFVILTSWVKSAASKGFRKSERKDLIEELRKGGIVEDIEGGFGARGSDAIGGQHLLYMSKTVLRLCTTSSSEDTRALILEKSLDQKCMRGGFVEIGDLGVTGVGEVCDVNDMMKRSLLKDL